MTDSFKSIFVKILKKIIYQKLSFCLALVRKLFTTGSTLYSNIQMSQTKGHTVVDDKSLSLHSNTDRLHCGWMRKKITITKKTFFFSFFFDCSKTRKKKRNNFIDYCKHYCLNKQEINYITITFIKSNYDDHFFFILSIK